MAQYDYDIGIIGGGAAGLTVASGSAQLGASTLLIEKEHALGGDCLHYGCVPSKTLIKSAAVYNLMKRAGEFGLPEVELKPVDFALVAERIKKVISTIQVHDSVERFSGLGVDVKFGDPRFTDEHTINLDGKSITASKWLIATGSSPSVLNIEGAESTPFITNKEIFSLSSLPPSMIVLGGGAIAIEMAQAFQRLGSSVTVVQRSEQIMVNEDADMADAVKSKLESEGIIFHTATTLLKLNDKGTHREVTFTKDGKEITLKGDTIFMATGRSANVDDMGLEDIGIELSQSGINVDARMRTNHKHIFAAGDVTGAYQFTHAAGYEGGIVISNAIFRLPRKADYTYMPHCTYSSPELASIGMNEKTAKAHGIEFTTWTENFESNDRAIAEGETTGKIKLLLDAMEKPLGVQILGPHAGELLSEWVALMNTKGKLSAMASAVHPYPTMAEINKRVAGGFLTKKLFSDRVRRILKLLFLEGR